MLIILCFSGTYYNYCSHDTLQLFSVGCLKASANVIRICLVYNKCPLKSDHTFQVQNYLRRNNSVNIPRHIVCLSQHSSFKQQNMKRSLRKTVYVKCFDLFWDFRFSRWRIWMKFRVYWDVAPCSHVEVDRRFRWAYYLHRQHDNGGSTALYPRRLYLNFAFTSYLSPQPYLYFYMKVYCKFVLK
jgi:hypothetical protein